MVEKLQDGSNAYTNENSTRLYRYTRYDEKGTIKGTSYIICKKRLGEAADCPDTIMSEATHSVWK